MLRAHRSQPRGAGAADEQLRTDESCTAAVDALLANPAGAGLRKLGDAPITTVDTDGDKGEVRVKGLDRPIDVVRSDGRWRIRSEPTGETD